jgi:hypothetical protein
LGIGGKLLADGDERGLAVGDLLGLNRGFVMLKSNDQLTLLML